MSHVIDKIDWNLLRLQRESLDAVIDQMSDQTSREHLEGLQQLLDVISDEHEPREFVVVRMVQENYTVRAISKRAALEAFYDSMPALDNSFVLSVVAEEKDQ